MQYITEKQINLISRRLNAKHDLKEVDAIHSLAVRGEEIRITPEQAQKGFDWLMNLYKSPSGKERKNNPFGIREMNMLDTGLGHFTYDGHFDAGNAYHEWYTPIYSFVDKEGFSFQYYVAGGSIHLIG